MTDDRPMGAELVEVMRRQQDMEVKAAYSAEEGIVRDIRNIRKQWVALAAKLYDFNTSRLWVTLGYESLDHWLATPDVELSRRTYYNLIEAHRELVVERGVDPSLLGSVDVTKVAEVLPAVRRGHVSVDIALADCEVLTRNDLRDKYSGREPLEPQGAIEDQPIRADHFHYEKCPQCGAKTKVWDA